MLFKTYMWYALILGQRLQEISFVLEHVPLLALHTVFSEFFRSKVHGEAEIFFFEEESLLSTDVSARGLDEGFHFHGLNIYEVKIFTTGTDQERECFFVEVRNREEEVFPNIAS